MSMVFSENTGLELEECWIIHLRYRAKVTAIRGTLILASISERLPSTGRDVKLLHKSI